MTKKKVWIALGILAVVFLLAWRWMGRAPSEADDPDHPESAANIPEAAVVRVEPRALGNTLTIAGEFKPFQDVEVHAKVAGYIRNINVDVGDHVKAGQVLAVLEIPELTAQVQAADAGVRYSQDEIVRAQNEVARDEAAYAALHAAAIRLKQASSA